MIKRPPPPSLPLPLEAVGRRPQKVIEKRGACCRNDHERIAPVFALFACALFTSLPVAAEWVPAVGVPPSCQPIEISNNNYN